MHSAEEISVGLAILNAQAHFLGTKVDIGTDCDFLYAGISSGHMTSEAITCIQITMESPHWFRNMDELLQFSYRI